MQVRHACTYSPPLESCQPDSLRHIAWQALHIYVTCLVILLYNVDTHCHTDKCLVFALRQGQ